MGRAVRLALVLGGVALFALLVRSVGLADLARPLADGRALAAAVVLELVVDACHTLGWRAALAPAPIGFWRLYWVRQAGTAVNQLTPTATLGGELVKAMLVRPWIATTDAVASLLTAKVSFAVAQALLVLLGLAALIGRVPTALGTVPAIALATVATLAALLAGVAVRRRGIFSAALRAARRLRPSASLTTRAAALDARLAAIPPGAFARSVAWHGAGQLVGVVQLLVILHCLGTPVGAGTALAIEALAVAIDSALFFVPARIGVQEGGRVLVFTALGFSAAIGLAVALVVRAGQLATVALGVAAFGYLSLTSPAAESISGT